MPQFLDTIKGMSRRLFIPIVILCWLTGIFIPAAAQAQDAPRQVTLSPVYADSALRLTGRAQNGTETGIVLWGISSLAGENSQAQIRARLALENLIGDAPVNCTIKAWRQNGVALAQCLGLGEKDLALAMIEQGHALADRRAIADTLFDTIYRQAEDKARRTNMGLWPLINAGGSTGGTGLSALKAQNETPFRLTKDLAYFMIAVMVAGPFIGMLIVAVIIYGGFRRLISLQKYQMAVAQKKDRAMREREKFIVAASLEGEINTNRAKLDAFIIIYEEMLKNLRDPAREHKYKKGGDIIHEKPALSRNVYDSNIDKLDLLGQQIVTDLTGLYTMIEPNPDYKTIEPDTPIDDVIDFVNKIVRDAEALLQPMDKVGSALNVIVRDKRAKSSNPVG